MKLKRFLSIGEAAKLCGMSIRKIRYLSNQGLIQEPAKSVCGDITYRLYTPDHIEQIKLIKRYQDQGYTLRAAAKKMKGELSDEKK